MSSELFKGIHYYVVDEKVKDPVAVKRALKEGGASREFYMGELVTHVVSDMPLDGETLKLTGQDHAVVHSDWVVMSQRCGAMLPTTPFDPTGGKIFSGLTFCPSKLSVPDVEKLCVLLLFHGGKMQRRLDSKVTHLITTETAGAKYECARGHRNVVKIVSPDWVVDSVDANTRLEEDKYHPSELRPAETTKELSMETCNGALAVDEIPVHPAGTTAPTPMAATVEATPSAGKGVATRSSQALATEVSIPIATLPASCHIQPSQAATPTAKRGELPRTAKATPRNVKQAATPTDEKGGQATPTTEQATPTPKRREPTAKRGVTQKQADKSGTQATPTSGAQATPTTPRSEKLLDGTVLYFTDYQDCVEADTLEKWKLVVRQHGGEVLHHYDPNRCTHLLALHKKSAYFTQALSEGKCIASAHWLNDVLTEQKMFPPRNPIHFPTEFQWQLPNAEIYSVTLTNYTDSERELVKDMLRICGLPYTGHLSKENTHLICKRPEGKKHEKALEWGVQVVNSVFLADIIHEGKLPAALLPRYTELNQPNEFDPRMSHEASRILELWKPFLHHYAAQHPALLDHGSLTSLLQAEQEATLPVGRKRGLPDDLSAGDSHRNKIRRVESELPRPRLGVRPIPVVIFTGIASFVVKNLNKIIVRLGGMVTTNPRECTHIVTSRIARTIKFLSGISVCGYVVTPKWVEESGKTGIFRDEEEFVLQDSDTEKMFGMNLALSLSRAKRVKLLAGIGIYATPTVEPPAASMNDIVSCAGGRVLSLPEVRSVMAGGGRSDLVPRGLIILSTGTDIQKDCCKEFVEKNMKVYSPELILTGVLKQELDFSTHAL